MSVVVARATYDTDIDDLWDAMTNAERMPRWFAPVTGDFSSAARYQFKAMPAARSRAASRRGIWR